MTHLHSIATEVPAEPCETAAARPHPRLRPYVVGYSGFRSGSGTAIGHRMLPLNLVTVIVDFAGPARLITGPRADPADEPTPWGRGFSIGLTPAGCAALLGVRMADLAGAVTPLADLLGRGGAEELAERLVAAPGRSNQRTRLDAYWTARLGAAGTGDRPVDPAERAWWRLQRRPGRPRIDALAADLGLSRRALEARFQRHVGLAPRTVARIARFQRAVGLLARHGDLGRAALESGYADQPHFTREIRKMSGLTPTALGSYLRFGQPAPAGPPGEPAHSFNTGRPLAG